MRWAALMLFVLIVGIRGEIYGQYPSSSPLSSQVVRQQRLPLQKTLSDMGFAWGAPIFIRIFKAERELEIWLKQGKRFRHFRSYRVCTYGGKGLGPKTRKGDGRAPEGFYSVAPKQMNPYSRYYLAFNLGYPNGYDRYYGRTGSALMVHGECVSIGCFAMTNAAMEEIYVLADTAFRHGQPFIRVHIFPFKMNAKNMRRFDLPQWSAFWRNLKVGYDWFERHDQVPPHVDVERGRYVFN